MTNLYLDITSTLSLTDDKKSFKWATQCVQYNVRTGRLFTFRGTIKLWDTYKEAKEWAEKSQGEPCGKNRWKLD